MDRLPLDRVFTSASLAFLVLFEFLFMFNNMSRWGGTLLKIEFCGVRPAGRCPTSPVCHRLLLLFQFVLTKNLDFSRGFQDTARSITLPSVTARRFSSWLQLPFTPSRS